VFDAVVDSDGNCVICMCVQISYMCFLGLLSYYVLTELGPFEGLNEISGAEWMLIIWNISLVLEEVVQVAYFKFQFAYNVCSSKYVHRVP
jgi:hypothetical protein